MSELTCCAISTWHPDFVAAIHRHYTRSRGAPPGKKMAWRIALDDETIGWFGLGEPAYKLAPRRRLGLEDARPAPLTVGNFIFRLERAAPEPAASDVLRHLLPVFLRDWEARYGWMPLHLETLVDPGEVGGEREDHVPGYAYRRAGFRSLGLTTGRSARRPPGATHGARIWSDSTPKIVLYRGPLARLPAPIAAP